MVMVATKSGMFRRIRRGLSLTPSRAEGPQWRGGFLLPNPRASPARHRFWALRPTKGLSPFPYPAAPAGRGMRKGRINSMVSPDNRVS